MREEEEEAALLRWRCTVSSSCCAVVAISALQAAAANTCSVDQDKDVFGSSPTKLPFSDRELGGASRANGSNNEDGRIRSSWKNTAARASTGRACPDTRRISNCLCDKEVGNEAKAAVRSGNRDSAVNVDELEGYSTSLEPRAARK